MAGRRVLRNPKASQEEISELVSVCWQSYPGAFKAKKRNKCIAQAQKGKSYKDEKPGPPILNKPVKLWSISEPWPDRPTDTAGNVGRVLGGKTGGDTLRSMARGWRPPNVVRFQEIERKATIIGALAALQAIEVAPWTAFDLSKLPPLKLKDDRTAQSLLSVVGSGANALGKPAPRTIKDASEFMRQEAKKHGAGGVAWYGRAAALSGSAVGATKKRDTVEGAVATGLSAAKTAMHATTAGSAATVVGLPVAAVTGIVGGILEASYWITKSAQSRSKVEKARSEAAVDEYAQLFNQEIDKRGIRQRKRVLEAQIQTAQTQRELEQEQARLMGEKITKVIVIGAWAGALGGTFLVGRALVRAVRGRAA